MNEEMINHVLSRMSDHLDNSQMIKLRNTLEESLQNEERAPDKSSAELLELFIATKRLEGRSAKTLNQYRFTIGKLMENCGKNVCVMDTEDIRVFLMQYREEHEICKTTVDNIRRTLSSFFKYLASRKDSNPALFVSIRRPYNRLHASGVETMLKKAGVISDVGHVHPHKFRRTMATTAIDRGMPIEQVQKLLGHEKIDTTLQYAMVKQSNVKLAHKKFMS